VLFQVADHLNKGRRFVTLEEDKVALAKINLSAARSSASKSAFDVSAEYVIHGLAIVDSVDLWKDFRGLAFELSTFAARMFYITGQFGQCHSIIDIAVGNMANTEEAYHIQLTEIHLFRAEGKPNESIQAALRVLRNLGETIPSSPTSLQILYQVLTSRRSLRYKSMAELECLPLMTDRRLLKVTQVCFEISTTCFFGGNPKVGALSSLRLVELVVRHGISTDALQAFGFMAIIESNLGRHEKAYEYALLVNRMVEDPKFVGADKSRVYTGTYSMLVHWNQTLSNCLAPDAKCIQRIVETRQYRVWCLFRTSYGLHRASLWLALLAAG
jgi:predicted ATPase